jgi:hypothetical protein
MWPMLVNWRERLQANCFTDMYFINQTKELNIYVLLNLRSLLLLAEIRVVGSNVARHCCFALFSVLFFVVFY